MRGKALGIIFFVGALAQGKAPECPKALKDWPAYQREAARYLSKKVAPEEMPARYGPVEKCLAAHKEFLGENPRIKACVAPIADYLAGTANLGRVDQGRALGFSIPDAAYFEKTKKETELPKELTSPEWLKELSDPAKRADLRKRIAALNATRAGKDKILIAAYRSEIPTADEAESFERLVLVYPDPKTKRDVWVQYGVNHPETKQHSGHTFVLSVATDAKDRTSGYFGAYSRTRGAIERLDYSPVTNACLECHRNEAPLTLKLDRVARGSEADAKAMNARIRSYSLSPSPYDTSHLRGPSLGPDIARPASLMRACTKELEKSLEDREADEKEKVREMVFDKIRGAMNCASCHDGEQRGRLNPPMGWSIHDQISSGRMPPRKAGNLNEWERYWLEQCLYAEYYGYEDGGKYRPGVLFRHFTKTSCTGEKTTDVSYVAPDEDPAHAY